MSINVTELLADPDFLDSFCVTRQTDPGSFVNGIWTPGEPTEYRFRGCIQTPSSGEWESLPESVRERDAILIYTKCELQGEKRGEEGQPGYGGDIIAWRVRKWKIVGNPDSWQHRGYVKYVAVQLEAGR